MPTDVYICAILTQYPYNFVKIIVIHKNMHLVFRASAEINFRYFLMSLLDINMQITLEKNPTNCLRSNTEELNTIFFWLYLS